MEIHKTVAAAIMILSSGSCVAGAMTEEQKSPARVVRVEATIQAPASEVWRVLTTSRGAEEFFAEKANIRRQSADPMRSNLTPRTSGRGPKA